MAWLSFGAQAPATGGSPAAGTTIISFDDIRDLWDDIRADAPTELRDAPPDGMAAAWVRWARSHDAAVRARVVRGDEDSLVNLWLFGTSFTSLPPARPRDIAASGDPTTLTDVIDRRLSDLLEALAHPGGNERLEWAAAFFAAQGASADTGSGAARIRERLIAARRRVTAENADFTRVLEAPSTSPDLFTRMRPYASLYGDRGLSSDTSLLSSYAIDSALETLTGSGLLEARSIRRVAIVGPGLDVINKADGHDFYPEQTIQPFTLIESLVRLGLSRVEEISVTTFDVSARVNQHLLAARDRARSGEGYVIQLPLSDAERWTDGLIGYWGHAASEVGDSVPAAPASPSTGAVRVRAVRVRPEVVRSVVPRDLNIVVERLDLEPGERFDLVVATNVFIYYDRFEQTLGLLNLGTMMRPGGSLLVNQALYPVRPFRTAVGQDAVAFSDQQFDPLFWYVRD